MKATSGRLQKGRMMSEYSDVTNMENWRTAMLVDLRETTRRNRAPADSGEYPRAVPRRLPYPPATIRHVAFTTQGAAKAPYASAPVSRQSRTSASGARVGWSALSFAVVLLATGLVACLLALGAKSFVPWEPGVLSYWVIFSAAPLASACFATLVADWRTPEPSLGGLGTVVLGWLFFVLGVAVVCATLSSNSPGDWFKVAAQVALAAGFAILLTSPGWLLGIYLANRLLRRWARFRLATTRGRTWPFYVRTGAWKR